jgi:uncharacterized protein (TIGR03086 family)
VTTTAHLKIAHAQFADALDHVSADDWATPTPCERWTVKDLVGHLIGGELMATALLDGCSSASAMEMVTSYSMVDPVAEFASASASSRAAFTAEGALDRTVHHPIGDIPGEQLLGFRVIDATLHSWDLRRSIGLDETIEPELVAASWERLEPLAPVIASTGIFGSGPSGEVTEDAALELRLLDLTGRRP